MLFNKGDKLISVSDCKGVTFNDAKHNQYELDLCGEFEIILKNGKYYAERIMPRYPANYKECCDVLGLCTMDNDAKGYKGMLIIQFQELLIARDAYWMIAGKQMGLGKSWKFDFDKLTEKYAISCVGDELCVYPVYRERRFLVFPTEEMCKVFLDNFREQIMACRDMI